MTSDNTVKITHLDSKRQTWTCRIGVEGVVEVPPGGDAPMRHAVQAAFERVTGVQAQHCFSGWGDTWDEGQLAVIENRLPETDSPESQINRLANFIMAEVPGEPSQSEGAVDTAIRLMRVSLAALATAGEGNDWHNGAGADDPDPDQETMVAGDADDMQEALKEISAVLGVPNTLDDMLHEIARLHETWLSIETAPKDGRVVLVGRFMEPWGFVYGSSHFEGKPGAFLSGWISRGLKDPPGELGLAHPTHWMPLPPPPAAAKRE